MRNASSFFWRREDNFPLVFSSFCYGHFIENFMQQNITALLLSVPQARNESPFWLRLKDLFDRVLDADGGCWPSYLSPLSFYFPFSGIFIWALFSSKDPTPFSFLFLLVFFWC